jgi:hypothetical protein
MDYLIKKSDSSIVQKWGHTIGKLTLPEQTGGDVVFTGDKRPLDLGDYILVKAKEVDEALDATKKRGATEVVVDGETVTVTKKAVAKSAAEIAQDKIFELEAAVTARRLRDAFSGDADALKFIADVEDEIAIERGKL